MSIDVNVQNDLVIVTESSEDIVVNVSNAAGPQGPAGAAGVGIPVGGTTGQVLKKFTNTNYDTYWAADASGLTSVGLSVPTGLTVSNSPLTTNGTIAVGLESGYSIPSTASQATWNTAYNDSIVSAGVTGTTTKTLTLNQQDGGTVTASWTDINTDAVTSVFGRSGAVVAEEGDYTLTQLGDVTLTSPTNGQVLKYNGTAWVNNSDSGLTSVGLSMPSAFAVSNSPLTSNGTIAVTGAGTASQYVRGDGQLATLPSGAGGGSSVNYYLNGSVNQGTIGGSVYYEMNRIPVIGTGTDFTRTNLQGDGLIAQFITDANDPNRLEIPAGAWNFEMYFNVSSAGGTPAFYLELLKYDGTTFTSIANGSTNPETITGGTAVDLYLSSLAVPQTTLLATDRLAIRVYVITSGRNITLHTEDNNLCEIITTFAGGVASLNGLTANTQYFAVGTTGTDFAISSLSDTHTFNLPDASATARGLITTGTQTIAGAKTFSSSPTAPSLYLSNMTAGSGALYYNTGDNRLTLANYNAGGILMFEVNGGAFAMQLNADLTARFNGYATNGFVKFGSSNGTLVVDTTTYTPTSRNITINGTTQDLSADRTYTIPVHDAVTIGTANGLSLSTQVLSLGLASSSANGALSSTDWSTFNGKFNLPSLTSGSVLFSNGTTIAQDNANFFWDDTNNRLGIGTTSPASKLDVNGTLGVTGAATFSSSVTISGNNDLIFRDSSTYISSPATDTLRIITANNERLRITSGGNLLLGTTTDNGSKFQVSGAATFSSSVTAASFIKSGGTSAQILAADGSVITAGTNITISGGTISSSGGGGSVDELQVALLSQVYG